MDNKKYPLFVYGTLMWPQVLRALTGKSWVTEDAVLKGFKRCRIKGAVYPGIKREPASSVKGKVVRGLGGKELSMLDQFEGDAYERVRIQVNTESNKEEEVFTYVIRKAYKHILSDQEWKETDISDEDIKGFLLEEI